MVHPARLLPTHQTAMSTRALHCFLPLCLLLAPLSAAVAAGETVRTLPEERARSQSEESVWRRWIRWSDARMRGVFDVILPETQEKRTWRVSVQPHFNDIIDNDHVRLPVNVVYGFSSRFEGEFGVDPYFTNPFRDGHGNGVANYRTHFKYRWTPGDDSSITAASGVQWVHPVASSPADLNEGVNRYSIYTSFARPSPTIPNLDAFLTLSYDFLAPSSAQGWIDEEDPQDDFVKVSTGVLYRKREFTYGLALSWAQTVDGGQRTFISITPSVIYDVPRRFTSATSGRWQVGAAVEALRHGADNELGLRVRVRWLVDFKQAWRKWRDGDGER